MDVRAPAMAKDEEAWARDIAFGGSVKVTVLVTEVFSDDDTGESGSATCRILINDQVVAKSVVDVANGLGSCTWTNDGR